MISFPVISMSAPQVVPNWSRKGKSLLLTPSDSGSIQIPPVRPQEAIVLIYVFFVILNVIYGLLLTFSKK